MAPPRVTFCPDGFFVHHPSSDGILDIYHTETEFIAYSAIRSVSGEDEGIAIRGANVHVILSLSESNDLFELKKLIIKKWMRYHVSRGNLSELTDAIRHLPNVMIMGEAVQQAATSFQTNIK